MRVNHPLALGVKKDKWIQHHLALNPPGDIGWGWVDQARAAASSTWVYLRRSSTAAATLRIRA
jgi:hypothetical protein